MALKSDLRKVIKEELSINNDVMVATNSLARNVVDDVMSNFKTMAKSLKPGIKVYDGSGRYTVIFNGHVVKISIGVKYFHFSNKEIYETYKYEIDCNYATSSSDGRYNFINLYCYGINGTPNITEIKASLQHEIEHLYQANRGDKKISTFDKVYDIAARNLFNKGNKALMYLSNIIYYSYEYEQDGYVNGLYSELINNENPTPRWEDIKESSAYVGIMVLRKSLRIIEKNREKKSVTDTALNNFSMDVETIISMGKKAEKRFLQKIGKVLIKVRKDREEKGVKFENTKPWITDYFLS